MATDAALLSEIPFFALLDDQERAQLAERLDVIKVETGKSLFSYCDPGGSLYIVREGEVELFFKNDTGERIVLETATAGHFFGEMSLLDGQPRSASATALLPTRLLVLDREHFQRYVLAQARIVAKLLRELSKRLRGADQAIENLALGSVHDRLSHLLGHLGRRSPLKNGVGVVERSPTHQELAEMVGSSRETVTRTLAGMEKAGLIAIDRRRITLLPAFFSAESARA